MSTDGPRSQPAYLYLALATWALLCVPLFSVTITPIADLPQQLAQIPLFAETVGGEAPEYRIQWLTPNKLSYPLLGLAWLLFEPLAAARVALALVAGAWVGSVFWLAARRRRPVSHAALASVFVFNHTFCFGFLNFIVGVAAFAYWFERVGEAPANGGDGRRVFLRTAVGSLLLYFSHALWLAAGLAWLAVVTVLDRPPARVTVARALGVAPAGILAAFWYPSLIRMGWETFSLYGPSPLARLAPGGWVRGALGAVTGPLEPAFLLLVGLWIALALLQNRKRLRTVVDGRLLLVGLFLLAGATFLPEKIDQTLKFATRWLPVAAAALLLAVPAPSVRPLLRRTAALTLVAAFGVTTAAIWGHFEREELSGLEESLARLTPEPRVLGLDFYRDSPRVRYPAYLQMHAYAQLVEGGRLSFSFVRLASSLVVRRDFRSPDPWTMNLEWRPGLVRKSDLDHFDFVLIHGPAEVVAAFEARDARLTPQTAPDRWRLYRIVEGERNEGETAR